MSHGIIKDGVYIKHEDEKQQLRLAGGSWSINMSEIDERVTDVKYICGKKTYSITWKDALHFGFLRVLDGEDKLVVPLKNWEVTNDTPGA